MPESLQMVCRNHTMRLSALAVLLIAGIAPSLCEGVEWNGYTRRLGVGSSAGYHVYDACPWMHTRHTDLAHSVCGFYYGGHPKYQLHSPNAGFYSTQCCMIAPFGPSYGGLHNYSPSAPYRGVYPLTGCCNEVPVWSDAEYPEHQGDIPAEAVEPGKTDSPPTPPVTEAKPAKARLKSRNVNRAGRVTQSPQPVVRPVR
jgi:hypothetical protein